MRKKITLQLLLLAIVTFTFQSCGDDEKKATPDVLIAAHRQTGVVYKINVSTGALTKLFVPKLNGDTLGELRAFVYHPGKNLFYASASSETYGDEVLSGYLYSINPSTKAATVINDNPSIWFAINNWAVTEDDSLIGIGYFRPEGTYGYMPGVLKFGTDGEPAGKLIGSPNICCGNGMLFDKSTGTMLLANGEDSSDGEIIIDEIIDGEITGSTNITTLTDFPEDQSTTWSVIKAMAMDSKGNIYGLFFNDDLEKTYFVLIDLEEEEITYISTLGVDNENQYNALAFIPGKYAK